MATKDQIDKVWKLAKPIRGKDPDSVRQDPYGDEIHKEDYGKTSKYGWEIDHITPESRGGSDSTRNLQALRTVTNREKGDSLVKRSRHNQEGTAGKPKIKVFGAGIVRVVSENFIQTPVIQEQLEAARRLKNSRNKNM